MSHKNKVKNRRLGRARNVLDVKLRSGRVRAARTRIAAVACGAFFATLFGLYLIWRAGEWALDRGVYKNKAFAVRQIDVRTDGVISPDQIRRWSRIKPGDNLFELDLARVKRDLELAPVIESASVERVLPGTVRVRVTEREPVAQITVAGPRDGGGIELIIFQMDGTGAVMLPLDPRQRSVPLHLADDQLPVIFGINFSDLQPGRTMDSLQARAALRLIAAFESSPMAGLVALKQIDVSRPDVLVVTTGEGSEITFGPDDLDRQLLRWWKTHEECRRLNRVIATLDLAVNDNIPLRLIEPGSVPPPAPKNGKSSRSRKKNV